MSRILICDDERDIVSALKIYLGAEGFECLEAYDGAEALKILGMETVQAVLLDIMMPIMDGITALHYIRQEYNVPVILLTAKGEEADKVLGLNVGADDYVTKPFNPAEVVARVKAQVRRYTRLGGGAECDGEGLLSAGDIEMNLKQRAVYVSGEPVSLTATEYDILRLLMGHPGQIFTSREIYRLVWKEPFMGGDNTIAVHIRHLREKIEINPAEPRYLKVVWGRGYKIEELAEPRRAGEKGKAK